MSADQAAIVGLGLTTAVGLTVAETSASVRARTARFAESDLLDGLARPFTLAQVPDDGLPPLAEALAAEVALSGRERRLLRLAARPLREALEARHLPAGQLPGLCLALPETATQLPLDQRRFLQCLVTQSGGAFDLVRSDASHVGRAGGLVALAQAMATIASGQAELMLAGGVDTFRDLCVLGQLDVEGRVKSASNLDGFIPGEAAAFVLLASTRFVAAHGLKPIAHVVRVAAGFEAGHLYSEEPYRGEALSSAVAQLAAVVSQPVTDVYSSMNGESHWAKEWGIAVIRNRAFFGGNPPIHHPADCFGDTGAATAAALVGLSATAIGSGRCSGPALVCCSSDRGPRAAAVIAA